MSKCFKHTHNKLRSHLPVEILPDGQVYVLVGENKVYLESDLLPKLVETRDGGWASSGYAVTDADLVCLDKFGQRLRASNSVSDSALLLTAGDYGSEYVPANRERGHVRFSPKLGFYHYKTNCETYSGLTEICPGDTLVEYRPVKVRTRGSNYLRMNTNIVMKPVANIKFETVDAEGILRAFERKTAVAYSIDFQVVTAHGKPIVALTSDQLDADTRQEINWRYGMQPMVKVSGRRLPQDVHDYLVGLVGNPIGGLHHRLVPVEPKLAAA